LPSESQLCKHYNISPMTVRRAINVLLDQGVVYTERGRGTFVKPLHLDALTFGLGEFTSLFHSNQTTRLKLLEAKIVRADEQTATHLDIARGERTIRITSLIMQHDTPLIYRWEYLIYDPTRPTVEAELEVTSLRGVFTGHGTSEVKRGEMAIEVTVVGEEVAAHLAVAPGQPAFHLVYRFFDYSDRPLSWGGFICCGHSLRFTTAFGVRGGGYAGGNAQTETDEG
jgi:GntR family transcriptional regulator